MAAPEFRKRLVRLVLLSLSAQLHDTLENALGRFLHSAPLRSPHGKPPNLRIRPGSRVRVRQFDVSRRVSRPRDSLNLKRDPGRKRKLGGLASEEQTSALQSRQ